MSNKKELDITKDVKVFLDIYGDVMVYPINSTVLEAALFIADIESLLDQDNKLEMQVLKYNIKNFFKEMFGDKVSPFIYSYCIYRNMKYDNIFLEPEKDTSISELINSHFRDVYHMKFTTEEKHSYLKNIVDYFKNDNIIPKEAMGYYRKLQIERYYAGIIEKVKFGSLWLLPICALLYIDKYINIHLFITGIFAAFAIFLSLQSIKTIKDTDKGKKFITLYGMFFTLTLFCFSLLDFTNLNMGTISGKVEKVNHDNFLGLYEANVFIEKDDIGYYERIFSAEPLCVENIIEAEKCFMFDLIKNTKIK